MLSINTSAARLTVFSANPKRSTGQPRVAGPSEPRPFPAILPKPRETSQRSIDGLFRFAPQFVDEVLRVVDCGIDLRFDFIEVLTHYALRCPNHFHLFCSLIQFCPPAPPYALWRGLFWSIRIVRRFLQCG